MIQPLYDEEFVAVVPANHPLAHRPAISRQDVKNEPMLLLGSGHCFRDQVLDFCADTLRSDPNAKKSVEGSSLQTICYMVAQGLGVTILPSSAVPFYDHNPLIRIVPFERPNIPKRRVVLALAQDLPACARRAGRAARRGAHPQSSRLPHAHKPPGGSGLKL